jgi:hypothetical protein
MLRKRRDKEISPHRTEIYLALNSEADVNFFCLLLGLPDAERKEVVRNDDVRRKVNKALGRRFPTFIFLLDLYVMVAVITCFGIAETRYNKWLFGVIQDPDVKGLLSLHTLLKTLLSGGAYFSLREIMQAFSFYSNILHDVAQKLHEPRRHDLYYYYDSLAVTDVKRMW